MDINVRQSYYVLEVLNFHRNTKDLCPITIWAYVIKSIIGTPGTDENSSINFLREGTKDAYVTSQIIIKHIRSAVQAIGEEALGFTAKQVGTHYLRTSCTMLLYLAGTPVYTILLIGRWCSDAFCVTYEDKYRNFRKAFRIL